MSQPPAPVNPADLGRGPLIMGLAWALCAIAIAVVAFRFYLRRKVGDGAGWDDWLMLAALACNIVADAFLSVGYSYGLGKHDMSLTPEQEIGVIKWSWLATSPGLLVSCIARVSIAVLLVRVFGVHIWFKWFMIIVTALCIVMTIVIVPCTFLQVTPVAGNWEPFLPAKRWNPQIYADLAYFGQSLWTFTDASFVLIPVAIIWRLQMPLRNRVGLVILSSVSLITMVLSILKTVSLSRIAAQESDPTVTDVLYNTSLTIIYTILELGFVIIMGCVPPLCSVTKLRLHEKYSWLLSAIRSSVKSSTGSFSSSSENFRNHQTYEHLEMPSKSSDRNITDYRTSITTSVANV